MKHRTGVFLIVLFLFKRAVGLVFAKDPKVDICHAMSFLVAIEAWRGKVLEPR